MKLKRQRENPELAVGDFNPAFIPFQADPVGFCTDVLHETFTDDVKDVMRSVVDNPITIAISANAVGKTHGAARVAAWFYKCFPGSQVYSTSAPPVRNLYKLLWGEIYGVANKHPDLFKGDRITGDLNIMSGPQQFIAGVPIPSSGTSEQREAKFSGKHAPYLLFIIDEGDAVPPEVYKGIESCMSGGMARMLIMFNPRAEVGTVANMIKNHQGNVVRMSAFSHPNVIAGKEVIPGAVTREKTLKRVNMWTRPLAPGEVPDNECFQVPDFLVGTTCMGDDGNDFPPLPAGWRKVENPAFFYMVLGIYPPQAETQLISQTWLDNAVMRWRAYVAKWGSGPPKNVTPVIGIDVSDMGRDNNVETFRYAGFVQQMLTWKGVDTDMTAIKSVENINRDVPENINRHAIRVFVDATGVGSAVAPRMKRLKISKAESVYVASAPTDTPVDADGEPMGEFFQLRDQLWWATREWLRTDPGAMLPPDEDLLQELHTPLYTVKNGRIKITDKDTMREQLGRSPDRADSLCLTFAPANKIAGAMR